MARFNESRLKLIIGAWVLGLGVAATVGLVLFSQGKGRWKEKVEIYADFRQVSGLKKSSPVQLEGIEIGTVLDRAFIELNYPCDPRTEDRGRHGKDRTDACDSTLFCAPEGKCGELERYSFNKDLHPPCEEDAQCSEGEVCVTAEFRRRYRRVSYAGPAGVCVAYKVEHKRIRVSMAVYRESLEYLRSDSRAVISQNGVLGDQLVAISAGRGEKIEPGGRIQSIPATSETIAGAKDRIEGAFGKVEEAIGGIAELAKAMGEEGRVDNIQGRIASINEGLRLTAEGEGFAGALLNDETLIKNFAGSLRSARGTAASLDRIVNKGERELKKIDADLQPTVDKGRRSMAEISATLAGNKDPNNKKKSAIAKFIHDPSGEILDDVESTLSGAQRLVAGVERGDGTLGRLVRDPKVYDDAVRFFQGLQRNKAVQFLIRWSWWKDQGDGIPDDQQPGRDP